MSQRDHFHQQVKSLKVFFVLFSIAWSINLHAQTATISGQIKDKITSEPVVNAVIFIEGTLFGSSSNELGYYEIKNVPPGKYKLVVSAVGYELTRIEDVILTGGESIKLNILLQPEIKNQTYIPPPKRESSQPEKGSISENVIQIPPKKPSFGLTVSAGMAFPTSPDDFTKYWNQGVNLGIGLGYPIHSGTDNLVILSIYTDYNRFSFNSDKFLKDQGFSGYGIKLSGGEVEMMSILLDLKAFIKNFYVGVGLGIYNFKINDMKISAGSLSETVEGATESGFSIVYGAGIKIPFSKSFNLLLEAKSLTGYIEDEKQGCLLIGAGLVVTL